MKIQNDVVEVRATLVSLEGELYRALRAPRPKAEASQRMAAALDAIAARFRPSIHRLIDAPPEDGSDASAPMIDLVDYRVREPDFAPLIVATHRRELEKVLFDRLQAVYEKTPAGLPEAERKTKVAELRGYLLVASKKEEALIRAAEREGFAIARRGDADPRVVLAFDAALPKVTT